MTRELIQTYETWDMDKDVFVHSITVWKEGDNYYQVRHPARSRKFDLDSLPAPDGPIATELLKGLWKSSLTECKYPFPADSYQKSPPVFLPEIYYETAEGDLGSRLASGLGEIMVAEAEIYELLKQHPHPNICVYYGCVREGKYLVAICLKRYEHTLLDAINSGTILDRDAILDGISKGLCFLHDTLGLAHNDINPSNIMLDNNGAPVIIDFDSCTRIGQELEHMSGSYGWVKTPPPSISAAENDLYALSLIVQYMDGKIVNCLPIPPDDLGQSYMNGVQLKKEITENES